MSTLFEFPLSTTLQSYEFAIDLDGTAYRFFFHYNLREGFWYFDLRDENDVAIVSGVKLVEAVSYLKQYSQADIPQGTLVTLDMTGRHLEPNAENIARDLVLFYLGES